MTRRREGGSLASLGGGSGSESAIQQEGGWWAVRNGGSLVPVRSATSERACPPSSEDNRSCGDARSRGLRVGRCPILAEGPRREDGSIVGTQAAGEDVEAATGRRRSAGDGDGVRSGMGTPDPRRMSLSEGEGDLPADDEDEANPDEPEAA